MESQPRWPTSADARAPLEAMWFGPPGQEMFGRVHRPAGQPGRGVVVMCPAMGQDGNFTHYPLRRMAESLCRAGFVVVRFDYHAQGNSTGLPSDGNQVPEWLTSIGHAVELGKAEAPTAPLIVVGVRIGALLAAEWCRGHDVDGLVLWDPPSTGRSLLRELRIRYKVAIGETAEQPAALTVLGSTFSPDTVAALGATRLVQDDSLPASHVLSIDSPVRSNVPSKCRTAADRPVDHVVSHERDDLLLLQRFPTETLAETVAWIDRVWPAATAPSDSATVSTPAAVARRAEHVEEGGVETVVTLTQYDLTGIVHTPSVPTSDLTVVFVPDALTPQIGVSRMWVETARMLGPKGVRSLRFDLSGCGDSPPHAGHPGHELYRPEHLDDLSAVVREVQRRFGERVVLVGLCSGGYHALEAALTDTIERVVLINPAFKFLTDEHPVDPRRRARQKVRPAWERSSAGLLAWLGRRYSRRKHPDAPEFHWDRWLEASLWQDTVLRRWPALSERSWRWLNRLVMHTTPLDVLEEVHGRTGVLMVAGDPDWDLIARGGRHRLKRLADSPRFTALHMRELDHSALRAGAKGALLSIIVNYLVEAEPR